MSLDVEFDSFTLQEYIFLKSQIMQNYCADAETLYYLKDWFAIETSIADWADFLREYNIFSVHLKKEWTPKRIRFVRALIKKMTIKLKSGFSFLAEIFRSFRIGIMKAILRLKLLILL